jgi:hypothetical protein
MVENLSMTLIWSKTEVQKTEQRASSFYLKIKAKMVGTRLKNLLVRILLVYSLALTLIIWYNYIPLTNEIEQGIQSQQFLPLERLDTTPANTWSESTEWKKYLQRFIKLPYWELKLVNQNDY